MVTEKVLRHQPTQKRSKDRVAIILKAAESVFQEVGYDTATTNAIAERAKIPIGSLYQYFRNKKAILVTLSERYSRELRALLSERFAIPLSKETIYTLSESFLDRMTEFYLEHPAFRVVFYGSGRTDDLGKTSELLVEDIIKQVYHSLAMIMPMNDTKRIMIIATVLVRSVRSSMPYAINKDNTVNTELLNEIKILTTAYLKSTLDNVETKNPYTLSK